MLLDLFVDDEEYEEYEDSTAYKYNGYENEDYDINNLTKDEVAELFYKYYGYYLEEPYEDDSTDATNNYYEENNGKKADWTIMNYICGSDLESESVDGVCFDELFDDSDGKDDALRSHPEWTGGDLGSYIGPIYKEEMIKQNVGDIYTISTINLAKIPEVKKQFSAMASKMNEATENVQAFNNLIKGTSRTLKFGSASPKEGYANLIDLSDFAEKAKVEVLEEAARLQKAIKDSMIWEGHGANKKNACGLDVYYPGSNNGDVAKYAKNTDNKEYLTYLDTILDDWTAPSWVYEKNKCSYKPLRSKDYEVKFKTYITDIDGEEYFTLKIESGEEIIKNVNFDFYQYLDDTDEIVYLGQDNNLNYDEKRGIYYDNFSGTWMCLGDSLVNANIIDENDDYNIYSIPIYLNVDEKQLDSGEADSTNLRVKYDFNDEKLKILGIFDGIEGGASAKGMRKLREGDVITPVYPAMTLESEDEFDYIGDDIVWSKKIPFEDAEIVDGFYIFSYAITDIFGKEFDSYLVLMQLDDGDISLELLED